jgi:DNA polymerase-3 subunit delta'
MLQNILQEFWDANKFATSWIIGTNNPDKTLQNIKEFVEVVIDVKGLSIDNNPDFKLVERKDTKYIAVDQIRELQQFLYTTSTVGEYKFAVINEAQLMNNNAANSCLKILEEPTHDAPLMKVVALTVGGLVTTIVLLTLRVPHAFTTV